MKRLILSAALVCGLIGAACSQEGASVTGPSVGAALNSLAQLAQSTIAVLDSASDAICADGCRVSKWLNAPAEPPSPINFTQGHATMDACAQAYGTGWTTTHLYCEEEGTCQPEDSWGLKKLHICAQ